MTLPEVQVDPTDTGFEVTGPPVRTIRPTPFWLVGAGLVLCSLASLLPSVPGKAAILAGFGLILVGIAVGLAQPPPARSHVGRLSGDLLEFIGLDGPEQIRIDQLHGVAKQPWGLLLHLRSGGQASWIIPDDASVDPLVRALESRIARQGARSDIPSTLRDLAPGGR